MRVIYNSQKGGKPLNMGMNQAKRVAHDADRRDRLIVLKQLGPGLPKQNLHHQLLVKQRHKYYGDVHDERLRLEAQIAARESPDAEDVGDAD